MRFERVVHVNEDVQDEFVDKTDRLIGFASSALQGLQFELTIFVALAALWMIGFMARVRIGHHSKPRKKAKKIDESLHLQAPVISSADLTRVAVPPRSPRSMSHILDDGGAAGTQDGGETEVLTAEDTSNIMTRLIQLCAKPEEQAKQGVCELKHSLMAAGVDFTKVIVSVVKICTAKRNFQGCLGIYDQIADEIAPVAVDRSLWSCLLFCAVESRCYYRCNAFFERLRITGNASAKDYWNMIRYGSVQGNWQIMLRLVQEMQTRKLEVDNVIYNTVLATCVSADQIQIAENLLDEMHRDHCTADVITYNTLMKGYAKNGNMHKCFDLYKLMRTRGLEPSQVTYGILLDGCISNNRVDRASEVFNIMISEGCPLNTVLYTTLIKGFAREGKIDEAMRVFDQMTEHGVLPDLITFSIVLKANCDAGRLEVALELLGAIQRSDLSPDEVIFNNLLAGCAKIANPKLAKRIYSDMLASGVTPSNATFSILIRLFSQCNLLDEATEMLQSDPAKHNVKVEARLFSQLIHCCIRARQGRRALEVYEKMCKQTTPDAAMHVSMLNMCVKLNMFETANELLEAIAANGGRISHRDGMQVVEAARRKKRGALVDSWLAAINSMGISEKNREDKDKNKHSFATEYIDKTEM
eukprot:TRINITY_DN6135_c0_g1_i1.p1 TRINITY_DN6135_c0_g1~~TRINITY_DN6135_c0_g1_i1.p1  ORF type:complete len:642 (-),score=126.93 TRINITY_DN6135_c0_g1_i1:133-2058(-)